MSTLRPKLWNGPSAQGEGQVRALEQIDAPYLSSVGPDFVAHKRGAFREVVVQQQLDDGYYSLGVLAEGSEWVSRIVASPTARGSFKDRGRWGGGAYITPSLNYIGSGSAIVPAAEYLPNPEGGPPRGYLHVYKTRNGKSFGYVTTAEFVSDDRSGLNAILGFGATFRDSQRKRRTFGVLTRLDRSEHNSSTEWRNVYQFCIDDEWFISTLPFYPGKLTGLARMARVSPTHLIAIVPVYHVPSLDLSHVLPYMLQSSDNGLSWSVVDTADLFAGLLTPDSVAGQPASGPSYNDKVVQLVHSSGLIPESASTCLLLARISWGSVNPDAKCCLFRINLNTRSMQLVADLSHSFNDYSDSFASAFRFGTKICMRWAINGWRDSPVSFALSDDGVEWDLTQMPLLNKDTGLYTALDSKTVACPMYDGKHTLYATAKDKDGALIWQKRATLFRATPEYQRGVVHLNRFAVLTQMRKNGAAAPVYPSAPWVADSAFDAPEPP